MLERGACAYCSSVEHDRFFAIFVPRYNAPRPSCISGIELEAVVVVVICGRTSDALYQRGCVQGPLVSLKRLKIGHARGAIFEEKKRKKNVNWVKYGVVGLFPYSSMAGPTRVKYVSRRVKCSPTLPALDNKRVSSIIDVTPAFTTNHILKAGTHYDWDHTVIARRVCCSETCSIDINDPPSFIVKFSLIAIVALFQQLHSAMSGTATFYSRSYVLQYYK